MSDAASPNWLQTMARRVLLGPKAAFQFVTDWWSTRYWSSFAWGLPAILAGLLIGGVGAAYSRVSPSDWARRYEAAAMAALGQGDWEAADVYFRQMALLDESSPAAMYGVALTAERQKDLPRARELLRRIAPESTAGYPAAHAWLAHDLIRQKVPATPQTLRVLEHHLQQALRSPASELEARVVLAQLYAAGGQPKKAIGELEQVVSVRSELQLDLARQYALAGRRPDSVRAAAKASEFFQARTQAEPDQPQHRLRWASSLVLQGQYEDAIQVLEAGLALPEPRPFQQALAATYFRWLDAITVQDQPQPARQLEFLERVIQYDPSNRRALSMLADLALREEEAGDQATAILKRVPDSATAPVIVEFVLGTQALDQGNVEQGLKHLEQAQQGNARIPEVLNNLAWGLAHKDEPELERALQLAQAAQQLSKHPETYDTIGTILAKLGRPREAVAQLETALRVLPPRADLHRKLGDLYEQLGDADLASEHRRLAERLDASP